MRLMHALRLLTAGQKTTLVALDAGYSTPSAFISTFRRVLGTTPGKYLKEEASWTLNESERGRLGKQRDVRQR